MSETVTISIHRALTELKTMDLRINKAIAASALIVPNRKSNTKIEGLSIEEFEKKLQAEYDLANSLITYRDAIKAAIVQSNALTVVKVAGEEMTVAQAIERKTSIDNKKKLLSRLEDARRAAVTKVAKENDNIPAKLEAYLATVVGNKENAKKEEIELHTKAFTERNEFILVDPLNAYDRINELREYIYSFEAEVDSVLSESNATTTITI